MDNKSERLLLFGVGVISLICGLGLLTMGVAREVQIPQKYGSDLDTEIYFIFGCGFVAAGLSVWLPLCQRQQGGRKQVEVLSELSDPILDERPPQMMWLIAFKPQKSTAKGLKRW